MSTIKSTYIQKVGVGTDAFELPANDGTSGQYLQTNGSGSLSWQTVASLSNAQDGTGTDFQFNSGYGSVATAYGCRAWVKFNGDGTVAVQGGGNVSSVTDRTTGKYTVNFTNSHPDANYSFAGATNSGTNNDPNHIFLDNSVGQTVSALPVNTARGLDGAIQDARNVYIATFR